MILDVFILIYLINLVLWINLYILFKVVLFISFVVFIKLFIVFCVEIL